MLRVMTWFWAQPGGRTHYSAQHVNIWADMVRRHLTIPHRLACVTDIPAGIDPSIEIIDSPRDFEDVRIPTWGPDKPQCLRRLAMFAPDAGERFGERFVSMDMDCVIADSLDPLFDTDADFKMYRGTSGERPYNGSMLLMTAGARPQVYDRFTPEGAAEAGQKYVGSDQAWISHVLGRGEATWGPEDGVCWYSRMGMRLTPNPRLLFFPGTPKPWEVADRNQNPFVVEHYRAEGRGRCLVLGYGPTVWADAEAAMRDGPYAAVIASPEAAEHWTGEVFAIARHDRHAERIARMNGFEPVFCGRSEGIAA